MAESGQRLCLFASDYDACATVLSKHILFDWQGNIGRSLRAPESHEVNSGDRRRPYIHNDFQMACEVDEAHLQWQQRRSGLAETHVSLLAAL